MDFQQNFLNAMLSSQALTKTITIHNYLPTPLDTPVETEEQLPFVQAYGNITSSYPYHYTISELDSFCLLFTESGNGTLMLEDHTYVLTPGTLAFIDCNKKHRIEIKHSPWHYKVFFMKGNPIPYLHSTYTQNHGFVHTFSVGSTIPFVIRNFFDQISIKKSDTSFLYSKFILDIILELFIENKRLAEDNLNKPDYLIQIKQNFENCYEKKYTLDSLEQEYHISKYQICREFTAQFGTSPIQYLNQTRIAIAKDALIYTDKRINEIGRMIGLENTNLFIRLFKKQTGVTPLVFRSNHRLLHT